MTLFVTVEKWTLSTPDHLQPPIILAILKGEVFTFILFYLLMLYPWRTSVENIKVYQGPFLQKVFISIIVSNLTRHLSSGLSKNLGFNYKGE